jgi:PhnB protein
MTANAALAQNTLPIPAVTGVTPYVQVSDSRAAAALYERAFGATTLALMPMESGKIIHGHIRINGGPLFLCDPFPEHGHALEEPKGYTLHLQVDDAKAWFDRAVAAGGFAVVMPVDRMFWGDDYGQLRDPYGILWSVGSTPRT